MTDLNDLTNQIIVLTLIQTNQSTVYPNKAVIAQGLFACMGSLAASRCVQKQGTLLCSNVPCFCIHMIPN